MKKFLLMLTALVAMSGQAFARDKVTRDVNVLPQPAKTMLTRYFTQTGVNHIKIDKSVLGNDYEVVLNDGTELDFDKNGNLKEIDTGRAGVPDGLVMKSIRDYVASNYPGQKIVNMDIERSGYDIELANGTDLVFDRAGNFKRIDY